MSIFNEILYNLGFVFWKVPEPASPWRVPAVSNYPCHIWVSQLVILCMFHKKKLCLIMKLLVTFSACFSKNLCAVSMYRFRFRNRRGFNRASKVQSIAQIFLYYEQHLEYWYANDKTPRLTLKTTTANFALFFRSSRKTPSEINIRNDWNRTCNFNNSNQSNPNDIGEKHKKSRTDRSNHKIFYFQQW